MVSKIVSKNKNKLKNWLCKSEFHNYTFYRFIFSYRHFYKSGFLFFREYVNNCFDILSTYLFCILYFSFNYSLYLIKMYLSFHMHRTRIHCRFIIFINHHPCLKKVLTMLKHKYFKWFNLFCYVPTAKWFAIIYSTM